MPWPAMWRARRKTIMDDAAEHISPSPEELMALRQRVTAREAEVEIQHATHAALRAELDLQHATLVPCRHNQTGGPVHYSERQDGRGRWKCCRGLLPHYWSRETRQTA